MRSRVERTQSATAGPQTSSGFADKGSLTGLVGRLVEKMRDVDSVIVVNWGKGYSINKEQLKELLLYIIVKLTSPSS